MLSGIQVLVLFFAFQQLRLLQGRMDAVGKYILERSVHVSGSEYLYIMGTMMEKNGISWPLVV